MSKKAFVVVGPEGSGTRLVTELLLGMGCFGDPGHEQRLDDAVDAGASSVIEEVAGEAKWVAFRRSYPHREDWPDLAAICDAFEGAGYAPLVVVVRRNWPCAAYSQASAQGQAQDLADGLNRVERAEFEMAVQLRENLQAKVAIDYDFLVSHPRAGVAFLAGICGLEAPDGLHETIRLFNNDKHVEAIICDFQGG